MKQLRGHSHASVNATPERCAEFLADVERYPAWYPAVVHRVEVLGRDGEGRPSTVRAVLAASFGRLAHEFELSLAVEIRPPEVVKLVRLPEEPTDPERFTVTWRITGGPQTSVAVDLEANLAVPRMLPVAGIGDQLARGFVAAAAAALGPG